MSNIDELITADLAELGRSTADEVAASPSVAGSLAASGAPYRDDRPGAEGRRRALLETRLHELAFMPMACERIFVHRVSRAAAGGMAVLAISTTILLSMDRWAQTLVYSVFDTGAPSFLVTLLAGAVLAAYVVSGLLAERYYERRMRAALDSSGDTFEAIDKLRQTAPAAEAQRMLDRVDGVAIALPLAGFVATGLLAGVLLFFSRPTFPALWLVAESSGHLFLYLVAGLTAATVLGSAVSRERRGHDSVVVALAQHWSALVVGAVAMLAAVWYAGRTAFGFFTLDIVPTDTGALILGGVGAVALILPGAWTLLALRRREHGRLGLN